MDLPNPPLSGFMALFPKDAVEWAIEKSSRVPHDETIWKAVFLDKPAKKSTKRLRFSQSSRQQQASKHHAQQSSGKSVGHSLFSAFSFGSKASSSSSSRHGWGEEVLKIHRLPHSHRWEVYSGRIKLPGAHAALRNGLWKSFGKSTVLHSTISLVCLQNHLSSLLWLGLSQSPPSSGGSQQNVGEGSPRAGRSACPGVLQQALFGSDGYYGLTTGDRIVKFKWLRHPHQVPDGDGCICLGVDQERGRNVLDQPQVCLFPDSCPSGFAALPQDCLRREGLPVSGSLLWCFFSSPDIHQSSP